MKQTIEILPATSEHVSVITTIGRLAVEAAHRESCSADDMQRFLDEHYHEQAISVELADKNNHYHVVSVDGKVVGFSKIILNCAHENIGEAQVAKLDRIYLLNEYFGQQLGFRLFNCNKEFARKHNQTAIWLFTWVGNKRAVHFYQRLGFAIHAPHRFRVTDTHYNEHYQMVFLL